MPPFSHPVVDHQQDPQQQQILQPRRVTFASHLEIREHGMCLGDNPSADGVPLTIDWEPQNLIVTELRERSKDDDTRIGVFSNPSRYAYLQKIGYTLEEIDAALVQAQSIRQSRQHSITRDVQELKPKNVFRELHKTMHCKSRVVQKQVQRRISNIFRRNKHLEQRREQ